MTPIPPSAGGDSKRWLNPRPGELSIAGVVLTVAGLVLGGIVYAHHYRPHLLNDIAVALLCAGVLLIAFSIEGALERINRRYRKPPDL